LKVTAALLEGFVNTVLRKNFDEPTDTPDFHREIWELVCGEERKVAIAAPRSHAKSTTVTHAYALAVVLFQENDYVVIVSDTTGQSVQFLGDIKKELLENEDLRSLFSIEEFIKDTEDDIIVRFLGNNLFRIQAKGSEQKVRGLKWNNKRPNLIICDDLENDEIVMNRDRRVKFKRWFYGALVPSLSERGRIRVIGTILHLDSLLENIMPGSQLASRKDGMKKLIREDLKEYTDVKLPWKGIKYRAHTDDFKKLLWPSKKSAEEFRALKEDYTRQGLGDVYSQEMLNIPLDETNSFFNRTDFYPMKKEDHEKNMVYYVAADLAVSTRERSDYSVFAIAGMDEQGRLYLVHIIRDRMDSKQLVDTILTVHRMYKPILFGIEQGAIEKSIGPFLNEEMMRRGEFVNLVLLKPSMDKISRARSMQARMRAGACKFNADSDWYPAFEDELLKFPRDRHDDQVDAWAYIGLLLDRMYVAPTREEIDEDEYWDFVKNNSVDEGRSTVTGY
jgi:predicted phage terminase large subunit-like protein